MKKTLHTLLLLCIAIFSLAIFYVSVYAAEPEETMTQETTTQEETTVPETTEPAIHEGFYTEDGKTYYYLNGEKVIGWLTLDQNTYYFDEEGVMQTGVVKIEKYYYFFGEEGEMQTGLVKWQGSLYFFNSKGHGIKKGFVKCFDKKYRYGLGKGKVATGPRKINGKCYFFYTSTGTKHKKGLFTYKGRKYYCKGKGLLCTGYHAFKSKATKKWYGIYFSKKTGRQVKGKKIGYLKIPKSGILPQAYAYGIRKLNRNGWKLKKAFYYSVRLAYFGQLFRTSSSEKYAMRGFKYGHGNCYVMAATFFIQAKLLGYNAHQVAGYVGSAPHSWVTIKFKRGKYVYDPDFQHETGRWGYKIYYGKPGTWRYNSFHNIG